MMRRMAGSRRWPECDIEVINTEIRSLNERKAPWSSYRHLSTRWAELMDIKKELDKCRTKQ